MAFAVKLALPGVGKNLQDHASVILMYRRKEPSPFLRAMRADRIARALPQAYFLGTGFASDVPGGIVAFLKSRSEAPLPDLQILFTAASLGGQPLFRAVQAAVPRHVRRAHRAAAAGEPRLRRPRSPPIRPRIRRIMQNFLADRRGPAHAARGHPADARDRRAAVHGALRRRGGRARRSARRATPRSTPICAPPRSPCITRSAPAAWAPTRTSWRWSIRELKVRGSGGASRRRRLGHARHDQRQHQCGGDHDRREGRRHDPRPAAARARGRIDAARNSFRFCGCRRQAPVLWLEPIRGKWFW